MGPAETKRGPAETMNAVPLPHSYLNTGNICPRSAALPWLYNSVRRFWLPPLPSRYGMKAVMILSPLLVSTQWTRADVTLERLLQRGARPRNFSAAKTAPGRLLLSASCAAYNAGDRLTTASAAASTGATLGCRLLLQSTHYFSLLAAARVNWSAAMTEPHLSAG